MRPIKSGVYRCFTPAKLELLKVDNQLVDMRAELQRDAEGKVIINGIFVRVGNPNAPITTHNRAYTLNKFLRQKLNFDRETVENLKAEISEFLLEVYKTVENFYGHFGEMGIDFAVDKNKRIWFIECNSQSTKVSLKKSDKKRGKKLFRKTVKNLLQFAKFLGQRMSVVQSPSLAPLVGVFVSDSVIGELNKQRPTIDILRLQYANRTAATCLYFFSGNDINLEAKSIEGVYYHYEKRVWKKRIFPFPQVLYQWEAEMTNNQGTSYYKLIDELDVKKINPLFDIRGTELIKMLADRTELCLHQPSDRERGEQMTELRTKLQRDGAGELVVVASSARLPASGGGTSLYQYYRLNELFDGVLRFRKADGLQDKITDFVKEVYLAIESVYGPFGELTIKYTIDDQDNPYLIDCTTKPGNPTPS